MRLLARLVGLALVLRGPLADARTGDQWQDLPQTLAHRYGVIGAQVEAAGPDTLRVSRVRQHGPAARAGLRRGDLVVAADGYRLVSTAGFGDYVKSVAPGDTVEFHVLRRGNHLSLRCPVTDRRHLYFLMNEQGRAPGEAAPRHRGWADQQDSLERAARRLIRGHGAAGSLDSLTRAFRVEAERYGADCRLGDVHWLLHHPLKAAALARGTARELTDAAGLPEMLTAASAHLDLTLPRGGGDVRLALRHPVDGEIARLALHPLARAGRMVEAATARLDSAELAFLLSGAPSLLERFGRTFYLDRGDSAETEAHIRTLRLAKKVDVGRLVAAARLLAPLADERLLRQLRRAARRLPRPDLPPDLPAAFGGEFLLAADSEWGWILVGGEGDNYYGDDALLIVDLGGNDTYANNAGAPSLVSTRSVYEPGEEFAPPASLRRRSPVGAVVDLDGDDRYVAHRAGSVGAALGGVGLLVDAGGDDLYSGASLTAGAAFCGAGLLLDRGGNDVYLAGESAHGAAYFGLGLLLDDAGDDLYSAAQFGQGFGGTRGLGVLLDRRGNDRYVADRAAPSGYGTAGVYNGWSQGAGCGFRGYSAGGLGLLLDAAGRDRYQAGNFSQGVGYFFGLGALVDGGGHDRYLGTRYTQGASAHQAAGVLLDEGGDDEYTGRVAANQGGAWDVGIAVLEDRGGDDAYRADGLAQGAASMNGLGILLDAGGRDRYEARTGQAHGGSTSYWGGRRAGNLGLLIDAGGDEDHYSLQGRGNGATWFDTNVGIFSDD